MTEAKFKKKPIKSEPVKPLPVKSGFTLNEVFKNKTIPPFVKDHSVFKKSVRIKKIFNSIGLSNFEETCVIERPLIDLKKDNFVTNLLHALSSTLGAVYGRISTHADALEYLTTREEKKKVSSKIQEVYSLARLIGQLRVYLEPVNFPKVINQVNGKISLNIPEAIVDNQIVTEFGPKKLVSKNESLLKVLGKVREQCLSYGIPFTNIDEMPEFKTFNTENVTSKDYSVIFSSDGEKGAWDLLTMSMRGFRSCQRWDGEHHRCLLGSIVSKYVGIIYITSGADFEGNGSKMMRRSIVRYAIDINTKKPALIIDKMYPEYDDSSLKIFKDALSKRTNLPIIYAPNNAKVSKTYYVPFESIRGEMPERDWSYQDTPLRTSLDLEMAQVEEVSFVNQLELFKMKLRMFIVDACREASLDKCQDFASTIRLLRLNNNLDFAIEQIVNTYACYIPFNPMTDAPGISSSHKIYKKYLLKFTSSFNKTHKSRMVNLEAAMNSCGVDEDSSKFFEFIKSNVLLFCKQEYRQVISK